MKYHPIDVLSLSLLAFSAGYLARDLVKSGLREDVKKALATGKDKLRTRVDAWRGRGEDEQEPVIEIEREDGSPEVVVPDDLPAETAETIEGCEDVPAEVREMESTLRETLQAHCVAIEDEMEWSRNSSVTRFTIRPAAGVGVRSVISRADDLSLAFGRCVRVLPYVPSGRVLAVEIPNQIQTAVVMDELWQNEACATASPLSVPLGVDLEGKVRMLDLARAPHLLIGGSTGSGKSVFISSALATLMRRNTPDELRLLLIDPKMVEFYSLANTPHLLMPVLTDCREARAALRCLVDEMERRYELIGDVGARNIDAYNEVVKNDPDRERMPYIVVAIDELADLKMCFDDNDIEASLVRLAQKARAAGIHLIVGTQRPTVDVITGMLKANFPARLAFRVAQARDSRTILDMNGAECLCGRGDALFFAADGSHYRVQCGFISDDTVSDLAEDTRGRFEMRYNEAFMDKVSAEVAALIERESERTEDGEDDWISDGAAHDNGEAEDGELFWSALLYVAKTRKVATSFLQRRFDIGYAHAADIIDRMELLGYVSAAEDGNKPRKVLISLEDAIEVAALNGVEDDEE